MMFYLNRLASRGYFVANKLLLVCFVALFLFVFSTTAASAATFYVSTVSDGTGTANNVNDPYPTLRSAVYAAYSHADTSSTVLIRAGDYHYTENIYQRDFVAQGKSVVIKPYPSENATFYPLDTVASGMNYGMRFSGGSPTYSSGITIQGNADGGQITLDGINMLSGCAVDENDSVLCRRNINYPLFEFNGYDMTADGLIIRNSHGRGVQLRNVTNVTLSNSEIYNIRTKGISMNGSDITIDGNEIYNAVLENKDEFYWDPLGDGVQNTDVDPDPEDGLDQNSSCGGWSGVVTNRCIEGGGNSNTCVLADGDLPSHDIIIQNNSVHSNWGEGIIPYDSYNVSIIGNTVYDNYSVNMYVNGVNNVLVDSNYVYNTGSAPIKTCDASEVDDPLDPNDGPVQTSDDRAAHGFSIANENNSDFGYPEDVVITNNLIWGNYIGFRYWGDEENVDPENTYTNLTIAHNIIGQSDEQEIKIEEVVATANAPSNAYFVNNIIDRNVDYGNIENPAAWAVSNNHWVDGEPTFTGITHVDSTTGDPEFVGPTNNAGDPKSYFQVSGNSPVASTGISTEGMVPVDITYWSPATNVAEDAFGNTYNVSSPSKGYYQPNLAPTATIDTPASDQVIDVGASLNFTSTASDPESGALTYAWDFDGGASNSSSEDPGSVTFNTPGVYTVVLTVTDNSTNTGTDSIQVTVLSTVDPTDLESPVQSTTISSSTLPNVAGQTPSFNSGYSWFINHSTATTLYLINNTTGAVGKSYTFGITGTDIEALARGPKPGGGNYLYIGDIGCQSSCSGKQGKIYRVTEPEPGTLDGGSGGDLTVETLTFIYPHFYPDTESLMVNPQATGSDPQFFVFSKSHGDYVFGTDGSGNGDGKKYAYYITKTAADAAWGGSAVTLTKSASQFTLLSDTAAGTYVPGSGTTYDTEFVAADVSSDARHIALRSPDHIFYWNKGDSESILEALARTPTVIKSGTGDAGYEAIAFNTAVDGFYSTKQFSTVRMQYYEFSTNTAPSVNAGTDQSISINSGVASLDGTVSDDGTPNPPATVTTTWSKISGPGTVTFGDSAVVDTTATFSSAGTYVLRLTATDSSLTNYDEMTVTVAANVAPESTIDTPASNQTINEGGSVNFTGTGNDPEDGTTGLTYSWNFDGGATNSTSEDPGSVTFNTPGVYDVTFAVTDQQSLADSSPDTVTITVNDAPTVNAGTDEIIGISSPTVNLDGTVSDDGVPSTPGTVTTTWSKQSGPGTVTFGDASAVDTTATFGSAGTYVLRLTADDGLATAYDEMTVEVAANGAPQSTIDTPNSAQTIAPGGSVSFTGTGSDPEDGTTGLTYAWNFDGGATNSTSEDPGSVTFNTAGEYTVTFTVTDGDGLADPSPDSVLITVNDGPTVDAGTDQAISINSAVATLDGTVSDDGVPSTPGTVTTTWSKQSGPGTVTFGNASSIDTTATFSSSGTYVLRLTADDGLTTAYDEMTVSVAANAAPESTINTPASDQTIAVGESVSFTGTGSDPEDGTTGLTYSWNFDGGATNSTSEDPGAITFSSSGTYTVTFTVTDDDGLADPSPDSVTITVGDTVTPEPELEPEPEPETQTSTVSQQSTTQVREPQLCTESTPGNAPDLFQIEAGKNSATLFVNPASGSDGYFIEYGVDDRTDMYAVPLDLGEHSGVVQYTIYDLQPGWKYSFRIRGSRKCAAGSWSQPLSIRIKSGAIALSADAQASTKKKLSESNQATAQVAKSSEKTDQVANDSTASAAVADAQSTQSTESKQTEANQSESDGEVAGWSDSDSSVSVLFGLGLVFPLGLFWFFIASRRKKEKEEEKIPFHS